MAVPGVAIRGQRSLLRQIREALAGGGPAQVRLDMVGRIIVAEMVAGGELITEAELKGVEIAPHRPERLKGARFGDGLAYGVAVLHEPPVGPSQLFADDVVAEEARLKTAIASLQAQIDQMLEGHAGLVETRFEGL